MSEHQDREDTRRFIRELYEQRPEFTIRWWEWGLISLVGLVNGAISLGLYSLHPGWALLHAAIVICIAIYVSRLPW